MPKQEMIAMILAGGQGSRLGVLTEYIAKPAVPYGSKYRIIDFALSNCTNSGIETVGVLTQYSPLELNSYIGNGYSWDLDRNLGGLSILPPYQSMAGSDWYKGTANAIYQNIQFIDNHDPDYVLILSGDHIYKQDYRKMLRAHIKAEADATIAVREVPWDEASRFGIMNADEEGRITEFEEKPAEPKSNLASMGVYIFSWKTLRRHLIEDELDLDSSNDFGQNIIPAMLNEGLKLLAYTFSGYWKDVGTIFSLWESNMDLLDRPQEINLQDALWRIYCRNILQPSHYIGIDASIIDSVLTDGVEIYGTAKHSVISSGAVIEEGAEVIDSILMPGAVVKKGSKIDKCIVGIDTVIGENVQAGHSVQDGREDFISEKFCSDGITVFGSGLTIADNVKIAGNSMLFPNEEGQTSDVVLESTVLGII
ncbi:MAG: glucose-1-phosphate adenylyltransferase [Clostridiaceae bacterium]|jgi:glucose-1-phosphate adenylyltransferase|nr:glucose-1-phosphate adenylyltransferase [Bacillota bacterium]NLN52490.1 glucose-1-phosphate adenylyltransferase [Clostridiaceae bacterium]